MVDKIKKYSTQIIAFVLGFTIAFLIGTDFKKSKTEESVSQLAKKEELKIQQEEKAQQKAQKKISEKLEASKKQLLGKDALSSSSDILDYLKVSDQKAGKMVNVAFVKTDEPVWVVVHMEKDGKIWNALGARLVRETSSGVEVPLLVSTKVDKRYWVALYKDNGDGKFSLDKDQPLKLKEQFVILPFKTLK